MFVAANTSMTEEAEIKRELTFHLFNADYSEAGCLLELVSHGEECAMNEHPEIYHYWMKLLQFVPESEALEWVDEICDQIQEGTIAYEWDAETKTFKR